MRVALIGDGKTGSKVVELLGPDLTVFNIDNPPTLASLKGHDVIICFTGGGPFLNMIDLIIESQIPLVVGATGFEWPDSIRDRLEETGVSWVYASNFSLGMNIAKTMIEKLSKAQVLFNNPKFSIHEVHHTKKLDAPSGTALSWRDWLGCDAKISSERVGDVVGVHQIKMESESETIELKHTAKDRRLFAEGAIWMANKMVKSSLTPGLHQFSDIVSQELDL